LKKDWTLNGISNAVKLILKEGGALFDDIIKNMERNEGLFNLLHGIIISGERFFYEPYHPAMRLGIMFGILSNKDRVLAVHNKIFELFIRKYFVSLKDTASQKKHNNAKTGDLLKGKR